MSSSKKPAYRKHGFTLCLIGVVLLAWFTPDLGLEGSPLRPEWTTKLGVWIIFFLQGLTLPARELVAGYKPIRLQVFVLAWNYLLFPLITLLGLFAFARFIPADLALGFGLLAILPTTIASAVAFTALSGGRVSNALCATVLSNLLAVVIVPLWVALYLATGESVQLPLGSLFAKLALLIAFPLFLGQCLRLILKPLVNWAKNWQRIISSGIILFIVYAAFAQSVASGAFASTTLASLGLLIFAAILLLLLVSFLVWKSAACLRLEAEERIAAFYCASQKSLATGLPLATAILAALPVAVEVNVGALLLALIVYHPLQLVLAAVVSSRFGR